jgi:hypothetical protein
MEIFWRIFCSPMQNPHDIFDRISSLYPSARSMKDQFNRITERFGDLHIQLLTRNLVDPDLSSGREMKQKLTKIAFSIKISYEQTINTNSLKHIHDPQTTAMLSELSPESFFKEVDMSKLKKHQQLLQFYQRKAAKFQYRKDGDALYEPRSNEEGEFVYAYQYVCDVCDFVFEGLCPIEQNHYWFDCLTEKPGNAKFVIENLTKLKTEWLPNLVRNDMLYAFTNGLFSLEFNEFYYFKAPEGKLSVADLTLQIPDQSLIASKYHDVMFDEEGMSNDMAEKPELGYMAIKFTEVYNLLKEQDFDFEEQKFIFAQGGRLLFPLGKLESWQVFVYFLGLAGTGKSLFLRLVAKVMEKRDVAILSNALQKTFALDGVSDKKMYLGLDMDDKFQLDQTTFQSMVSGEEVSVLRKFKQPLTVCWSIHGGFAGNKLPSWTDNGGSLTRRVIVIEFLKKVKTCDPQLFEKCGLKIDRFLKIIVSAYHELVKKHFNANIKEVMPQKFRNSEKKALVELNTLQGFLSECCEIDVYDEKSDSKSTTKSTDMIQVFKDYCTKQSIKTPKFCYTYYNSIFSKNLISTETIEGEDVFKGVSLKDKYKNWVEAKNIRGY